MRAPVSSLGTSRPSPLFPLHVVNRVQGCDFLLYPLLPLFTEGVGVFSRRLDGPGRRSQRVVGVAPDSILFIQRSPLQPDFPLARIVLVVSRKPPVSRCAAFFRRNGEFSPFATFFFRDC